MADILNTLLYSYLSNADYTRQQNVNDQAAARDQGNFMMQQAQRAAEVAAHQEAQRRMEAEEAGKNFAIAKAGRDIVGADGTVMHIPGDVGEAPWSPPPEQQDAFNMGQLRGLAEHVMSQQKTGTSQAEKAREFNIAEAGRNSRSTNTLTAITGNKNAELTKAYSQIKDEHIRGLLAAQGKLLDDADRQASGTGQFLDAPETEKTRAGRQQLLDIANKQLAKEGVQQGGGGATQPASKIPPGAVPIPGLPGTYKVPNADGTSQIVTIGP